MTETSTAVATQQKSTKAVAVTNFQTVMNNSYYQTLLQNTLKENSGTFCTSLMELFTSDDKLMQCAPNDLMSEALKAASLRLPLNKQLGQCYILPFKIKGEMKPTVVIGTKGYIQLAMRTNKYVTINCGTIYEGMLLENNVITGEINANGAKTSDVPVGYFAYFKQKGGFEKMFFMSLDDVCKFAKTYAPTVKFSSTTWQQLKEIAIKQSNEGTGGGIGWFSGFQDMAEKTALRQLLSKWGELSVDSSVVNSVDEKPSAETIRNQEFAEVKEVINVDAETGEIKQPTEAPQAEAKENPFDNIK